MLNNKENNLYSILIILTCLMTSILFLNSGFKSLNNYRSNYYDAKVIAFLSYTIDNDVLLMLITYTNKDNKLIETEITTPSFTNYQIGDTIKIFSDINNDNIVFLEPPSFSKILMKIIFGFIFLIILIIQVYKNIKNIYFNTPIQYETKRLVYF